ncbi:MAG: hypothetical protein M3N54_12545 [Acidobacteriota bacterium]|nr:hypothetical protein [Acidobacteriota bacterium]
MIEEDYRVLSAARSVEGENCRAPIRPTPIPATAYTAEMWEGCGFGEADYRTFAPYPDQTARLFAN